MSYSHDLVTAGLTGPSAENWRSRDPFGPELVSDAALVNARLDVMRDLALARLNGVPADEILRSYNSHPAGTTKP